MSAHRIQRRRTKGWRMPESAVYVGRGTDWGNPYRPGAGIERMPWLPEGSVLTVEECVEAYRQMMLGGGPLLTSDKWLSPRVGAARGLLAGKDLACWCPLDQPCHADVLLELANGGTK